MGGPNMSSSASGSSNGWPVNSEAAQYRMLMRGFVDKKVLPGGNAMAERYPLYFVGDVCRDQLKTFLANYPPKPSSHGWEEIKIDDTMQNVPKQQLEAGRQLTKRIVLSHLVVFNSNRLLTQALRDSLPLSFDSATFNQLRNEAYIMFGDYEDEFLWDGFYQLINNMLDCHGQAVTGDFRVDPDIWERNIENLTHTEQFLLDTLNKELWLEYFDMFDGLADWDVVFGDRDGLPFFCISTLYTTMCFEMVEVVLSERRINPVEPEDPVADAKGKGKEVVLASWAPAAKRETMRWNTDPELRANVYCFFESMGGYPDFAHVELESFPWIRWDAPSTDALLMDLAKETMRHRYIKKHVPKMTDKGRHGG